MIDYQQAILHCQLLTGESDPKLHFRVIYDPDGEPLRPDLIGDYYGTLSEVLDKLNLAQQNYCGIFVTVNITDGLGVKKKNIVDYRAFFIDYDGVTEPTYAIQPSFTTRRDSTHGHAYWLIKQGEIDDPATFNEYQKRLALAYGTDQQITNTDRVLRLCGSLHFKDWQNPKVYTALPGSGQCYSLEEIRQAHQLNPEADAILHNWVASRKQLTVGTGFIESDHYNRLFVKWCGVAKPAVQGEGTYTLIQVASWGWDHAVPLQTAKDILWEHYNPRCEPPWQDWEQWHFDAVVERAYEYSRNALGCRTHTAMFKSQGEIPPPVNGWDENLKIVEPVRATGEININNRINREQGEILFSQMTLQSAHYDLAQAFDGKVYDGHKIIRCDKTFYVSNNKSWKEVSDPTIKAEIHRAYSPFRPNDTFTRGVFNVFCDHINRPEVRNGMWLSNPYLDGTNVVVFQDGMIDFNTPAPYKLQPHDPDFFTFNECDYEFNQRDLNTPHFDKFMTSCFGNDEATKTLILQWFGYCLTNSTDQQKFMVFSGESRSGKGTITRLLTEIVGVDNVCSPSLADINKDNIKHIMSMKKVALIPDAHSVNHSIRESTLSTLKAITGGDSQTFDVKYKPSQTVTLPVRITMSTNNMPDFNDPSGALVNRMLIVVFDKSFAGREDTTLGKRLSSEKAKIARKALIEYTKMKNTTNCFIEPEDSKLEREEIREDMFPLARFVNTCCLLDDESITAIDALYAVYLWWCETEKLKYPLTKIQFGKTLKHSSLGLKKIRRYDHRNERVSSLEGISIKTDISELLTHRATSIPFPAVPDHS